MANKTLPTLRADLELTIAPNEEGGAPMWMLHDPLHATFTQIDWIQFEIIKRLDKPQIFEELISRLNTETTIREDDKEIMSFIDDLFKHGLTSSSLYKSSAQLEAEQDSRKQGALKWIIFHYLYFRIPIIHPDKFLESSMPIFRALSSKFFLLIYFLISATGLFFLSQRFDEYVHTFTNFLNPKGIFIYGVSIAALKIIHEFSHAFTAKHYGNRVPTMGLAFIVLWPIPYCDVTDSWRMSSREKRLRISAAGIIAELVVAGFALFIWGISDDSPLKSMAFVLSSLSLIGTLLVNLNPLMRFDGYYIFSDLTGIDNLQSRAFSMTRWFYRRILLGIKTPCPEPTLNFKRKFFMIVYSVSTWIYRFFLYTGIAIVVYYTFPKIIGIFMFGTEIVIFLIKPLYSEFTTDYKLISGKKISLRFALFVIAVFCLFIWISVPFTRHTSLPAITTAEETQILYSPQPGIISKLKIKRGTEVKSDDILMIISSKKLMADIIIAELTVKQLANDLRQLSSQPKNKGLVPQIQETYLRAKAELRALRKLTTQSNVKAEFSGTVTDLKETLKNGVAVYKGEELGKIYNLNSLSIRVYATSSQAEDLNIGDELIFTPNYSTYKDYSSKVYITKIHRMREDFLQHPELSSLQGGQIDVSPNRDGKLKIMKSYFEIECDFKNNDIDIRFDQPGRVTYWSKPRSYLQDFIEHVYQIIIRESGV